jgi:hypothetical protein
MRSTFGVALVPVEKVMYALKLLSRFSKTSPRDALTVEFAA